MAESLDHRCSSADIHSEPKAKILLVDDNPANLLSLRAILEDLGQNLVEAHWVMKPSSACELTNLRSCCWMC